MSTPQAEAAAEVRALAFGRRAGFGGGRLVCIDGPAGSGKTSLAAALVEISEGSQTCVVHMDDLYPGWQGMERVGDQVRDLLHPLSQGRTGSYRRFDWSLGRFAETVWVEPVPFLVLEGVAAGDRAWAALATVLVWVEVEADVRLRRGLARDGKAQQAHWMRWIRQESEHFAREMTCARADIRLC